LRAQSKLHFTSADERLIAAHHSTLGIEATIYFAISGIHFQRSKLVNFLKKSEFVKSEFAVKSEFVFF
jgi:hypothetical protein